jgi:energy-coupling factor transport system ATP-binding protein
VIINLEDVSFRYKNTQSVFALRDINLTIRQGEYVAIVGANGSGKSTLARHLNGLLLPETGKVQVAGLDTRDASRLGEIRRHIQMIFQQPDAQIVATVVEEDVAFGPENFGVPSAELHQRVRTALETVGMWEHRSRPPHQLSAGQKQRVAIAGALAVQPEVLVLDEATAMLDPAGRNTILDLLRSLHAAGVTLLTITHEMDEAAEAERIIVMSQGRVAMDGSPRQIFERADELQALGLEIPLVADVSRRLGLPLCLTPNELLKTLGTAPPPVLIPESEPVTAQAVPGETGLMIEVRDLQHAYLRGTPFETRALNGISMQALPGEVIGLIGQTGSGKSTLMQHFNGLMRPQSGHVIINGHDWADPKIAVTEVRRGVGLLFQQPEDQLFERYIGDDIAFGPRQQGLEAAEVRRRVQQAMQAVGLDFETFKDRTAGELSGGEKRRAALAGVLALQPRLLVVDEPTAGLDPHSRAEILNILKHLHQEGVTIVMASHRMGDIATLCQRVIALQAGQVLASGPTRHVLGGFLNGPGGLNLPSAPVVDLAETLRRAGWALPPEIFTLEEVVQTLTAMMDAGVRSGKAAV